MSVERAGGQKGNQRRRDLSAVTRRARTQQRVNIVNNAAAMQAANENDENQNPNIVIRASGLDNYAPTIRHVNKSDIKAKFPHQHLTPIEGETVYDTVQNLEEELADNALTAKVRFGGGKKGSLGIVYENANSASNLERRTGSSQHRRERTQRSRPTPQMTRRKQSSRSSY